MTDERDEIMTSHEPTFRVGSPTWPAVLLLALGVIAIAVGLWAGDFTEIAATGARL